MSKARRRKNALATMYAVNKVEIGFDYWYFKLLNYILGIYEYTGLPDSLPAMALEQNLMLTGHAVVFESKGELVTDITTLYNFNKYYNPTQATFGNALIPFKNLTFGKDAEVIYNNRIRGNVLRRQEVDGGLSTYIKRYARLLADLESTIDIYIVNSRLQSYPTAKNQQMATQLEDFNARVALGERAVLTDSAYLDAFRNVDIVAPRTGDTLNDLLIARDKILATFFREIGVKFVEQQKRAQLTEDEVVADEQLLLINLDDMLQERKEGLERVNAHFGTSISVRISQAFDRKSYQNKSDQNKEKEESENGNTNDNIQSDTEKA